jgi:hypothetical protein
LVVTSAAGVALGAVLVAAGAEGALAGCELAAL